MDQLIIQIIAGVVVAIIVGWFGIGGTVKVIQSHGRPSKKWKWFILISWIMIFGGAAIAGSNDGSLVNLAANNTYAFMGFDLLGFGIIGLVIGRVGLWLNRY